MSFMCRCIAEPLDESTLIPRRVNVEVDPHGRVIAVSDTWIEDVDTGDEDREPISDDDARDMLVEAVYASTYSTRGANGHAFREKARTEYVEIGKRR